jgi:hypothetical protein
VTGAYKMYIGQSVSAISTSEGIKGLSKNVFTNGASDVNIISSKTDYESGKYLVIAIPSGYKIKEAVNSFGLDGMSVFAVPETVEYELPNQTKVNYSVYNSYLGEPYGFNSITIGK